MQILVRTFSALVVLASLTMTLTGTHANQSSGTTVFSSDAEIRKLLAARVDALSDQEHGIGIVVGVVGPQGRRIISYGQFGTKVRPPSDGDIAFEIGSVTKIFTAMLLADMARKGEVALDDPATKYLPPDLKLPKSSTRSITLLDLATHTSGLPFMPDDLPAFAGSVTEKYSVAQLEEFLRNYELPRENDAQWDYSNLGYWVLGQALGNRAKMDYEDLLRVQIIDPLKLKSTSFTAPPKLKARLAIGHNAVLQPAPLFAAVPGYSLMTAAGGLISTANDLLTVLSVAMGYESSPMARSISLMLDTRRPAGGPEQALGWLVFGKDDSQLVFHDGGTLGYASSVAWDPKQRVGVVVLSNQMADVGDIARHLLRPNIPLQTPTATRHSEIALEPTILNSYAGRYEAPGEGVFIVSHEGESLTIRLPSSWGLPKLRLRAETRTDFFVAEFPLRLTFQTTNDGRVNGLLLYPPRGQHPIPASRVSSEK